MFTTLGTDIADPVARLRAVREGTHQSKEFASALGARTLLDMADLMPGGLVGLGTRTSARLSLANRMRPVFNCTVTNMPGPRHPLYLAGAQLVRLYGAGMIVEGMGLIHPVMSYCGDITIAFTSDREMLPDPANYADALQSSFDELAAATTEPRSKPATAKKAPPRKTSTRKATPRKKAAAKRAQVPGMSAIATELTTSTPGGPADPTARQRRTVRAPSMPLMLAEQRVLFEVGALAAAQRRGCG